jgi:hypothetical protein
MGQWLIADVSLLDVRSFGCCWSLALCRSGLFTCGRRNCLSGLALPYHWRQSNQRPRSTKRGYMAKRTTRMATKSSQKVSKTTFRVIKKQAKERAVAEKVATKKATRPSNTAATLIGREARREERFRSWSLGTCCKARMGPLQSVALKTKRMMIFRKSKSTLNLAQYR